MIRTRGGLNTQMSFYHQNVFCILKILQLLQNNLLDDAKIEQRIKQNPTQEEIDLILVQTGNPVVNEFYEVKSGSSFTCSKNKIIKTIKKLFLAYKLNLLDRAFIISDVDFKKQVINFEQDIKYISLHSIKSPKLTRLLQALDLSENDRQKLFLFCSIINFNYEKKLTSFRAELVELLEDFRKNACPNADHGIGVSDLISRLHSYLLSCLENDGGNIDLNKISEIITDWVARNIIASNFADNGHNNRELYSRSWDDALAKVQNHLCKTHIPKEKPGIFCQPIIGAGNEIR